MAAEKSQVIQAIKGLGRRVTVSDVAAQTGLGLLDVSRLLNTIAADTSGTLQVGPDGTMVYVYAPSFESAYATKGLTKFLKLVGQKIFDCAYFLLRISFGLALILSLLIVTVLIILVLLAKNNSSGNNNNVDGSAIDFSFLGDITRFFAFNINYIPYTYDNRLPSYENDYQAYTHGQYIPKDTAQLQNARDDEGFILNCFSFLFGDGNPNKSFPELKWRTIAQHIRDHNGVTTAEQLSCFTGAEPTKEEGALPVLVRYDGQPEVTPAGHILYLFPSLQHSAQESDLTWTAQTPAPPFLKEQLWPFSAKDSSVFLPVAIFGLLNLAGAYWLEAHATTVAVLRPYVGLIHWLVIYGAFFMVFPLIRYVALMLINLKIESRNTKRKNNYEFAMQHAQEKLGEMRSYAIALQRIDTKDIVYTTDQDILDQDFPD